MPAIITLLTDFGSRDSYVAEVKGVIASQANPGLLIDITHEVPPGDVHAAQYIFARAWPRFPRGSVHVVVVDPGVGTARRAIAAAAAGHFFVAPDNGVLSSLPADARFVELPVPPGASPTFHARDLFALAAAQIVNGTALTHLGRTIADPVRTPLPAPRRDGAAWVGEVVYVDHFGTLISNIPGDGLAPAAHVTIAGRDVGGLSRTFGEVEPGQLVAFAGSGGTVEIAVRDGSAAAVLGAGVGVEVAVGGGKGR